MRFAPSGLFSNLVAQLIRNRASAWDIHLLSRIACGVHRDPGWLREMHYGKADQRNQPFLPSPIPKSLPL